MLRQPPQLLIPWRYAMKKALADVCAYSPKRWLQREAWRLPLLSLSLFLSNLPQGNLTCSRRQNQRRPTGATEGTSWSQVRARAHVCMAAAVAAGGNDRQSSLVAGVVTQQAPGKLAPRLSSSPLGVLDQRLPTINRVKGLRHPQRKLVVRKKAAVEFLTVVNVVYA